MLVGPFTAFESLWILSRAGNVPEFASASLGFTSTDLEQSLVVGEVFLTARLLADRDALRAEAVAQCIQRIAPILAGIVRVIRVGTTVTVDEAAIVEFKSDDDAFRVLIGSNGFGAFEFSDQSNDDNNPLSSPWTAHLEDPAGVVTVYSSRGQRVFGFSGEIVAEQSRYGSWTRIPNLRAHGLPALVDAY